MTIGNGNYIGSTLANPENDARAMQSTLSQLGFNVMEYENLDQKGMKRAIDEFGKKLKQYNVGLFFYAGHGIQPKGYNFLIPVDAQPESEQQVEYDCVQADRVLAIMEASGAKVNLIILDAWRNNPFERSWTRSETGKELAFMNTPGRYIDRILNSTWNNCTRWLWH
ncbi:MAG: caspase family protein [Bacteroidales bacterium]|nr:caspase family protein [Bacteroidales bacterium]